MTDLTMRATRLRFRTTSEIKVRGKWRKICIEARPEYALVRLEGMRTLYTVPWDSVWSLGGKMFAASVKAEKKAKREGK